ncbi:MAG: hypothetical protein C0594_05275 [Marinilabiliales bacterium]|nr:MAG: hypothetical protein C0594_05275 [Marinilabiliales bacterium]
MSKSISGIKISRLLYWVILLYAFALPLYKHLIPYVIAVWIVLWLIQGDYKKHFKHLVNSKLLFVLFGFFLLHVFSLFYSDNQNEALSDLQVKLPIFLMPLLLITSIDFHAYKFKNVFRSFTIGNFLAAIICLAYAIYRSLSYQNGILEFDATVLDNGYSFFQSVNYGGNYFFYVEFSVFHHPSYFSMYIGLSIVFLLYEIINFRKFRTGSLQLAGQIALLTFFLFIVFLLNSRAGIIAVSLVALSSLISLAIRKLKPIVVIMFLAIVGLFIVTVSYSYRFRSISEMNFAREEIQPEKADGSELRLMLWYSTIELIKDHPVYGTGIGDSHDLQLEYYTETGLKRAAEKRMNAHNQFLDTSLELGIPGFFLLLFLFIGALILALKQRSFLLIQFLILVLISFTFESMLNTQSGVQFFSFFYSFLVLAVQRNKQFD